MPEIRNDGALINAITGLGTSRDISQHHSVGAVHRLGQAELDQLCQIWPLDVMCSAYPDAATAKGWDLSWPEGTDDKTKKAFQEYRSVVGTRSKASDLHDQELASDYDLFGWAGYLANVYRGSAIVLNIDDGRPPNEPIDTKNIRTITEVEVLDSFQIYPDPTQVANPLKAEHYHLQVTPDWHPGLRGMFGDRLRRSGVRYTYPIHRSRILRFPGVKVPPQVMRYNNGWDRSLLEKVWDQYSAWESTTKGVENLIKDYSLFVYQLSGFGDMLTEGNEDKIRQRVASLQLMASVMGGIILDKEEESVNFVTRQFSGLKDLTDSFRDMLIGASGIPHTILFGESPSGLGATGESEEKTWAKMVGTYQQKVIYPRLRRLYQLIFLAKDGPTNGEPLTGWDITFDSLLEQSEAEKIANRSTQAQTDNTYVQMGAIAPEEVRQSRFGGPEYSYETTLDDEAFEKGQQQSTEETPPGQPDQKTEPPTLTEPEQQSLADLEASRNDSTEFCDKDLHKQALKEAKAKFKIWPSAYSSGWLTRRYKDLYKEKYGKIEGAFANA